MKLLFTFLIVAIVNCAFSQDYTPHIESTSCLSGGPLSPIAKDIDGDQDLDIVYHCANDRIYWIQNEGDEGFTTDGFGSFHSISPDWQSLKDLRVKDMDGDGDPDIIASYDFFDRIAWYPNDGTGQFGTQQFAEEIIITSETEPWDIHPADLDGDGDLDLLVIDFYEDDITWYQNNGDGYFFQAGQQFISDQLNAPSSIQTADIDGDNDLDIIVSYYLGDRIAWFRNDGSENFSFPITVTTDVDGPTFIAVEDIDMDGDMDVFSKSLLDEKTAWYANDGNGEFGEQQVLSDDGELWDMNEDGASDLLFISEDGQTISWLENDGNGEFLTNHLVTETAGGGDIFYPADLDGDGDTDLITSNGNSNQIIWYENNGITETPSGPGDFNGDGSVTALDLSIFLVNFGTSCPDGSFCTADLDDDGVVGATDLSMFLTLFGITY